MRIFNQTTQIRIKYRVVFFLLIMLRVQLKVAKLRSTFEAGPGRGLGRGRGTSTQRCVPARAPPRALSVLLSFGKVVSELLEAQLSSSDTPQRVRVVLSNVLYKETLGSFKITG